jgi:hypothetical protein
MGEACSKNGEKMNAYRLLVRKQKGKRPLGISSRRWVGGRGIEWGGGE